MKHHIKQTIVGLTVSAFVWGSAMLAQAAPLQFFGEDLGLGEATRLASHSNADNARNSFLSNLIGVGTEDFEGFSNGQGLPLSIIFPGAGTATLTGAGNIAEVPTGTNGFGRYPISGDKYLDTNSALFAVEFDDPVVAFGFYGIDIGDFNGQIELEFSNGGTTTYAIPHTTNSPGGSVLYYGLIDSDHAFTKVSFVNNGSGADVFGFDDLTIGNLEQVQLVPNPEPGSIALFTTGLIGLVGYGWRRKRQTA